MKKAKLSMLVKPVINTNESSLQRMAKKMRSKLSKPAGVKTPLDKFMKPKKLVLAAKGMKLPKKRVDK